MEDRDCPSDGARGKTRRQKGAEAPRAGLRGGQPCRPAGRSFTGVLEAPSHGQAFPVPGWEPCRRPGSRARSRQGWDSGGCSRSAAGGSSSHVPTEPARPHSAPQQEEEEEGGELPERGRATDSAGSTRPPARPGPLRRRAEGPQPREGRGGGTGRGRAPAGRAGQGCPHLYHSSPRS